MYEAPARTLVKIHNNKGSIISAHDLITSKFSSRKTAIQEASRSSQFPAIEAFDVSQDNNLQSRVTLLHKFAFAKMC